MTDIDTLEGAALSWLHSLSLDKEGPVFDLYVDARYNIQEIVAYLNSYNEVTTED